MKPYAILTKNFQWKNPYKTEFDIFVLWCEPEGDYLWMLLSKEKNIVLGFKGLESFDFESGRDIMSLRKFWWDWVGNCSLESLAKRAGYNLVSSSGMIHETNP